MSAHMITPSQATQALSIPSSTLRRYASQFKEFLSAEANSPRRSYTLSDMETLRRIREMSSNNLSLNQIRELLPLTDQEDESTALLALPDFTQALELARAKVAHLEQALETQEEKIQEQEERLKRIEDHLNSPLFKRILSKPKKE